jgi:hypothetical protein
MLFLYILLKKTTSISAYRVSNFMTITEQKYEVCGKKSQRTNSTRSRGIFLQCGKAWQTSVLLIYCLKFELDTPNTNQNPRSKW